MAFPWRVTVSLSQRKRVQAQWLTATGRVAQIYRAA
ncbi:hypothetical protein PSE_1219 [Pseudovibrio sp. FO-BEG1]|nr:hypothetical protein PSE_1219 [Pseudovibrio sp. FO-BEG1]